METKRDQALGNPDDIDFLGEIMGDMVQNHYSTVLVPAKDDIVEAYEAATNNEIDFNDSYSTFKANKFDLMGLKDMCADSLQAATLFTET